MNTKSVLKVCISWVIGICALYICYVIGDDFCKYLCPTYDSAVLVIGMICGVFAVAIGDGVVKIIEVSYSTYDNTQKKEFEEEQ